MRTKMALYKYSSFPFLSFPFMRTKFVVRRERLGALYPCSRAMFTGRVGNPRRSASRKYDVIINNGPSTRVLCPHYP